MLWLNKFKFFLFLFLIEGQVRHLDQSALRPITSRFPVQSFVDRTTIQGYRKPSLQHPYRTFRWIERSFLSLDWHVQGCTTEIDRWSFLVQGRRSILTGDENRENNKALRFTIKSVLKYSGCSIKGNSVPRDN